MGDPFQHLPDAEIRTLAAALRAGRLVPPFTPVAVGRLVSPALADRIAARCEELTGDGMSPPLIAVVLEAILACRITRPPTDEVVQLVWTGPDAPGVESRDTGVVVRELFAEAEDSVLVAGFAVYQGREVFRRLAERMVERPGLRVLLCLDVHRALGETTTETEVVGHFAWKFVAHDWPDGYPLPAVCYDPRSIDLAAAKKSSLHAKCVVVDRRVAFVTSANFTEAAQSRNVEVGVLVQSPRFAGRLADHFECLQRGGHLRPVPISSRTE